MAAVVSSAAATPPKLDEGTQLALTRTRLAAERTLMSWVRTAFSMISFGFTIGKFFEYLSKESVPGLPRVGSRTIPILLILLGLVSLFLGAVEFRRTQVELAAAGGIRPRVTGLGIITVLVGMLGVLAFVGLFVRLNFF